MLKVFQLIDNPYMDNPYVCSLMDGICNIYKDFEWGYGLKRFWTDDILMYDIVHIHWPNLLVGFFARENITQEFEKRLLFLKSKGLKIVATCHNLEPHYEKDVRKIEMYKISYSNADCIIHLGDFSMKLLSEKYPSAKHFLLPHHVYDKLYKPINKSISLKKLNLDETKRYILCFGNFRDEEERQLVDDVVKHYYDVGVEVLAPHYYKFAKRKNKIKMVLSWIKFRFKSLLTKGLHIYGKYIDNELLPFFYGAADICLIQRKKILNSGNLPMAFYMGKVVVGPNVGNVGQILKQTGNPIFQVSSIQSVYDAIDFAFTLYNEGKGDSNRTYALNNLSTNKISEILYHIYCKTKDVVFS